MTESFFDLNILTLVVMSIITKNNNAILSIEAAKAVILWASIGKGRNKYVNICKGNDMLDISTPPSPF